MSKCCPFCEPKESILDGNHLYARFDKYPVTKGHTLIIPFRHVEDYFKATNQEKTELIAMIDKVKKILDYRYKPDGFNIGVNCGDAAGQTIKHLHIHIIPRYKGDIEDPSGGVRGVIPTRQKY